MPSALKLWEGFCEEKYMDVCQRITFQVLCLPRQSGEICFVTTFLGGGKVHCANYF